MTSSSCSSCRPWTAVTVPHRVAAPSVHAENGGDCRRSGNRSGGGYVGMGGRSQSSRDTRTAAGDPGTHCEPLLSPPAHSSPPHRRAPEAAMCRGMEKPRASQRVVELTPARKRGQDTCTSRPSSPSHSGGFFALSPPRGPLAFGELDERARQRRIGPPGMMELVPRPRVLTEERRATPQDDERLPPDRRRGRRWRARPDAGPERVQSSTRPTTSAHGHEAVPDG